MENLEEEIAKIPTKLDKTIEFLKECIQNLKSGFDYDEVSKIINRYIDDERILYIYPLFIKTNLLGVIKNSLSITIFAVPLRVFITSLEKNIAEYRAIKENISPIKIEILKSNSNFAYHYIRHAKCFFKNTPTRGVTSSLYFDFGDYSQFVVLLGDNAQGKTAILQNIITDTAFLCFKNNKAVTKFSLKSEYEKIKSEIEKTEEEKTEQIFLLGYSASRVTIQSSQNDINSEELKKTATHHLFNPTTPLLNIEIWLLRKKLREEHTIIATVCEMLAQLTPFCEKVELVKDEIKYTDNYGKVYKYTELSMGQKTIIALMGDIVIRLFDFQPEVEKVEDLQGIVLIDELEAHLHPKWQREFPSLLKRFLPKVQFIVSTHSPMIVLGMPKETCYFHVQKDQEGNIQAEKVEIDVENMLPNQILTSPLFGLESDKILSTENKGLENLHTETNFEELESRKSLFDRLREKAKNYEANKNANK